MISLSQRRKTTFKSFGSCIGSMVFKPLWHSAKLSLVFTKASAPSGGSPYPCCGSKARNTTWTPHVTALAPLKTCDWTCYCKALVQEVTKIPKMSRIHKLWEGTSEKLGSPIQYTTSRSRVQLTPLSTSERLVC